MLIIRIGVDIFYEVFVSFCNSYFSSNHRNFSKTDIQILNILKFSFVNSFFRLRVKIKKSLEIEVGMLESFDYNFFLAIVGSIFNNDSRQQIYFTLCLAEQFHMSLISLIIDCGLSLLRPVLSTSCENAGMFCFDMILKI